MKTIFVSFALLLLASSTVFAAQPRIVQDEIEGAAALAVGAYKAGGMSGVANQSKDCWQKVGLKSYLCLYLDLAGRYIDQSTAKHTNFPLTPYFTDEEFGSRAAEVYRYNNVDMQIANKHLSTAQPKVNSAVSRVLQ